MLNEETTVEVVEVEDETTSDETDETNTAEYWKKEALKNKAILERLNKKANEPKKEEPQSDDFDYGQKAYLKASGINETEFDFVKKEAKEFGGKLDNLLTNKYFLAELSARREQAKTDNAIPKGKGTNNTAVDNVDYWMAKPIEEVPQQYRRDVVNARLAQEKNKGKFYNS